MACAPACITPMHLREQSRRRARRAVEPIMAASPGKGSRTILVHSTARNSIILHHYAPYPACATPTPNPFPFDTCNGVSHDGCTLASSRKRHANALTQFVPPPPLPPPAPPPPRTHAARVGGGRGGGASRRPRALISPGRCCYPRRCRRRPRRWAPRAVSRHRPPHPPASTPPRKRGHRDERASPVASSRAW